MFKKKKKSGFGNPKRRCMPQILHMAALTTSLQISHHKTSYSQHSIGREATWRARTRPGGATGGARGRWVRNTKRTRVFFLPTSVSPFLSSMSEFLSFRIPAQSMLQHKVFVFIVNVSSVVLINLFLLCFMACSWRLSNGASGANVYPLFN